jgi:hypothetical protein
MAKGMSSKSSRLAFAAGSANRPVWNEGNRNGACPSLDPSQGTNPTSFCHIKLQFLRRPEERRELARSWEIEDKGACFIVRDYNGQALSD